MTRHTRTITAAVAALAVAAPAATAMPADGPIRTSSLAGTTSAPKQDLRSPDARDAARFSQFRGFNVDARHAALASAHHPAGTVTVGSDGFDWGDAAIGAGGTIGLLVLVAGSGAALTRRVRHPARPAVS